MNGVANISNDLQKVSLQNLDAGKTYTYRVVSVEIKDFQPYKIIYADTIYSNMYTFTTFTDKAKDFSFICLNDIHENVFFYDSLLKVAGDYDFVVLNGDLFNYISSEEQIVNKLIKPCAAIFAGNIPLVFVRGNHDARGVSAQNLFKYIEAANNYYYSFNYSNTYFLVMDCGEDKADTNKEYSSIVSFDDYRNKEADWLRTELKTKAYKHSKNKICLSHFPVKLDTTGMGHGSKDCAAKLAPLLQAKFNLLCCGHTHKAQLLKPEKNNHNYIIANGGGSKIELATVTKVTVKNGTIEVIIMNDNGQVLYSYPK